MSDETPGGVASWSLPNEPIPEARVVITFNADPDNQDPQEFVLMEWTELDLDAVVSAGRFSEGAVQRATDAVREQCLALAARLCFDALADRRESK